MRQPYLEVTYRHGRPIAAYYYLARQLGQKVHRSQRADYGIVVDFSADGTPIGLELTAPGAITVDKLNAVLVGLGQAPVAPADVAPLAAAWLTSGQADGGIAS